MSLRQRIRRLEERVPKRLDPEVERMKEEWRRAFEGMSSEDLWAIARSAPENPNTSPVEHLSTDELYERLALGGQSALDDFLARSTMGSAVRQQQENDHDQVP